MNSRFGRRSRIPFLCKPTTGHTPCLGQMITAWWSVDVDSAGPGTDYGFLIDEDRNPKPDPRSQWQPNGVHALSRVYDQNAFRWTDQRLPS